MSGLPTEGQSAHEAIVLYALMARDWSEALDEIADCIDLSVLTDLHAMLTAPPRPNTDVELNALFVGPVSKRIAALAPQENQ